MFNINDVKQLLLPVIKRLHLVILCLVLALVLVKRMITYATPMYESTAKIKLDDQRFGPSNNQLYKDFDVFVAPQKIEAEVEVLKSDVLLRKAIQKMGIKVAYYRTGSIRKTELFEDTPFKAQFSLSDSTLQSLTVQVDVTSDSAFSIAFDRRGKHFASNGVFGTPVVFEQATFTLSKTDKNVNGHAVDLPGKYEIKLVSDAELTAQINTTHLDIKAVDKDVPVIRIAFKSEVPEKAAAFVNALAEAYIEDYVAFKTQSAAKTVTFIDEQLQKTSADLSRSEQMVERYKLEKGIVNTFQETETGLRKLSQQRIQLANIDMDAKGLQMLDNYVQNDRNLEDAAPQFGFGDLLFTELSKKLKQAQDERRELLVKYTPENEKVKIVDQKITELKRYLVEGVHSAQKDLSLKRQMLETEVETASHQFDALPTEQRELAILEREFRLNEVSYNFLSQKRTDANIERNADMAFHRIIQYATPAKAPVSPNKTLLSFVGGLLGLLTGIFLAFALEQSKGAVYDRETIEKRSSIPVMGVIPGKEKSQASTGAFTTLIKNIQLNQFFQPHTTIAVTSGIRKEGKTYIAQNLADTLSAMHQKVLVVDLNFTQPSTKPGLSEVLAGNTTAQAAIGGDTWHYLAPGINTQQAALLFTRDNWEQLLGTLKQAYDVVIIDAPPAAMQIDALTAIKSADLCLYLFRANSTNRQYISFADEIKDTYQIDNIFWVINDLRGSYNYQGRFSGGHFTQKSFLQRMLGRMDFLKLKRHAA